MTGTRGGKFLLNVEYDGFVSHRVRLHALILPQTPPLAPKEFEPLSEYILGGAPHLFVKSYSDYKNEFVPIEYLVTKCTT